MADSRRHAIAPGPLPVLAALALFVAPAFFHVLPLRADIQPLRSDEATLLLGVDSARTSVLTIVAAPPSESRVDPNQKRRRLIGTGVVIAPHRILSTASMALPNGTFSVLLGTGEKRTASVKGVDRQSNVALFEVEGPPLPPLRQASPQSIAIGSWVAVIANVNVTRPQITLGRVVGRGERIDFPYSGDIVEIEAATYPGASGGAVLNEMGEWVAIVVGRAGKASPAPLGPIAAVPQGAEHPPEPADLLVALPVDQLQRIADDLESYGSVRRAFLGIQMRRGVAADSLGVLVEGIVTDSPAARAGIQAGDRILAFEGSVIHSGDEITSLVRSLKPDDEVELTLARGTEILPMHATLAGIVGTAPAPPPPSGAADVGKLKRELRRLQEETRRLEQQIKAIEAAPAR